jgi:hypothetical protein
MGYIRNLSCLFLMGLLLSACAGAAPTAIATQAEPPTAVPVDTLPSVPTFTLTSTSTCTVSPAPSATFTLPPPPTVTESPVPLPDFANARVIVSEVRQPERTNMLLGLDIPGLNGVYNLDINSTSGMIRFVCQTDLQRPERLWCEGPKLKFAGNEANISFYQVGAKDPVYQGVYLMLIVDATPMPVGDPDTWCPDRGKNVYCESEWRFNAKGEKCLISSCTDACGYYYSTDCPDYPYYHH